jgi:hypothetical protein
LQQLLAEKTSSAKAGLGSVAEGELPQELHHQLLTKICFTNIIPPCKNKALL